MRIFFKTLVYVCAGLLWIFFTDKLLLFISNNIKIITFWQTIKGTLYVLLTGIGLYLIIKNYNNQINKINAKLEKKTRILHLISMCNQILVKDIEEENFLNEICKLIVNDGGYKLAWIGFKNFDEKKSVKPVAYYGFEEGYLEKLNITWSEESEYGRGPVGNTVRTGKINIIQDITNAENFKPWLNEALKRGFYSVIALPIIFKDNIIGSINIYSKNKDGFDEEEVKLLMEMASDLSYGINYRRIYNENKRMLEKIKKDNEKLLESDRLKTNFLAIVSHELRTPLTPIKGFVEILLREPKEMMPHQKEYLLTIKNNALRLQQIINDLIDLSKIEVGIIKINKLKFDIIRLVNMILKDMNFYIKSKNITIQFNNTNEQILVWADENRIGQVIINLINNAVKFSNENSEIRIQVSCKKFSEINFPKYLNSSIKLKEKCVLFSIKDNGIGIEKEKLQQVFQKFYQVEDALVRKTQGLGLGLSISEHIIKNHDGLIWAESDGLGKGSTFNFVLPC